MREKRQQSVFTRPFSRWMSERRSIRVGTKADIVGDLSTVSQGIDFGVTVDNKSALKITAFYAGIRIISENIASLPKSVTMMTATGLASASDHRVTKLLNAPNGYTNKENFFAVLTTWLKDWGNAYAIIKRDAAGVYPVELHQVHPNNVRVTMVNGKKWYKVTIPDPDFRFLNGTYPDSEIIHVMDVSLDGLVGVNPIVYNAMALSKSVATEKFAGEFYRKGGNIKAVMETDGNLGDDKYEAFMKHFAKAAQNFDTPLLEYGVKYKQLSVNPVAAQLLQSETLSIQDVCRILGIPPHMVAELSHATFSNIEHQTIQFVQYTLRPIVKKFEVELERKLFFSDEQDKFSIKFSLDGLLRGDTQARSAYYHNAILDGYLSRNEVRALEGYEHKEGLDDMLYPLNTGVVGKEQEK